MPPHAAKSQALLRIITLVLATVLFIAVAETDARHDKHQRWLAETRRRQESRMIAHRHDHRRTVALGGRHHGHSAGPSIR
jgi:hypothetical protein